MAERQRNPLVGAFEAPQRFIRGVLIHILFTRSQLLSPPRLPSPSPAHIHSSFSPTAFLYNAQTSILVVVSAGTEFNYSALCSAASNYSRHPKDVLVVSWRHSEPFGVSSIPLLLHWRCHVGGRWPLGGRKTSFQL